MFPPTPQGGKTNTTTESLEELCCPGNVTVDRHSKLRCQVRFKINEKVTTENDKNTLEGTRYQKIYPKKPESMEMSHKKST